MSHEASPQFNPASPEQTAAGIPELAPLMDPAAMEAAAARVEGLSYQAMLNNGGRMALEKNPALAEEHRAAALAQASAEGFNVSHLLQGAEQEAQADPSVAPNELRSPVEQGYEQEASKPSLLDVMQSEWSVTPAEAGKFEKPALVPGSAEARDDMLLGALNDFRERDASAEIADSRRQKAGAFIGGMKRLVAGAGVVMNKAADVSLQAGLMMQRGQEKLGESLRSIPEARRGHLTKFAGRLVVAGIAYTAAKNGAGDLLQPLLDEAIVQATPALEQLSQVASEAADVAQYHAAPALEHISSGAGEAFDNVKSQVQETYHEQYVEPLQHQQAVEAIEAALPAGEVAPETATDNPVLGRAAIEHLSEHGQQINEAAIQEEMHRLQHLNGLDDDELTALSSESKIRTA